MLSAFEPFVSMVTIGLIAELEQLNSDPPVVNIALDSRHPSNSNNRHNLSQNFR